MSKGWCSVVCEWWVERGQTAIFTQVLLLTIAALLSHLAWGCSTIVHWKPNPLQDCSHFGIPVSTDWRPRAPCLYSFLRPPASAHLRLIYTGASLNWRLGRGSISNNIQTHIFMSYCRFSISSLITKHWMLSWSFSLANPYVASKNSW